MDNCISADGYLGIGCSEQVGVHRRIWWGAGTLRPNCPEGRSRSGWV